MLALISLVFIIIMLAGVVAAAEASIFTVPRARAKFLAEKSTAGKALYSLKESMSEPISTLVALTSLITIVGSVFTGVIAAQLFGEPWVAVFAACLTFVIMVFAEIIPKRIGERYAEQIALVFAVPLKIIAKLFRPFITFVEKIIGPLTPVKKLSTSEEEIAFLAKEGAREGAIEKFEGELIQRIFKLNDINAADMMTPRPLVFFLDCNKTLGEVEDLIYNSKHSRIPVYDKKPDHIVGVAHVRELLNNLLQGRRGVILREFAKPALVVHEDELGDDLLRELQKTGRHLAVVVGDHGRVVGVVSHTDIMEELVGEMAGEQEISPELIKRVSKNEIIVHGETQVLVVNRFFNLEIPDHCTLNGYLLKKFSHLPKKGEIIEEQNLKFIAEEVSPSAIERVRVIKKE